MLKNSSSEINKTINIKNDNSIADISNSLNNLNLNKTTNRCTFCKKKVGYLGFSCKCGGNYCSAHRFYEDHACEKLDEVKQEGKDLILKLNPKVIGSKLTPI